MWSTPSLNLLSDPLKSAMVVLFTVISMCQIELFNPFLYLKIFPCEQTND